MVKPSKSANAGGKAKSSSGNGSPAPKSGAGTPANTSSFHYFANQHMAAACKADKERIHKACDTPEGQKESADSAGKARLDTRVAPPGSAKARLQSSFKRGVRALDGVGKVKSKYKNNKQNDWLQQHCTGLWNKPGGTKESTEGFQEQIKKDVDEAIANYKTLGQENLDKIRNFADDYMKGHASEVAQGMAEKAAQRTALYRIPVVNGLVAFYSRWEGLGTLIGNVAGAIATDDMARKFDALQKEMQDISEKLAELEGLVKGGLEDAMANTMSALALANPCIKARKCLLVPYKDADKTAKGNGCCPGQTGHHVLPGAMFSKYAPVTETKTDSKGLSTSTTTMKAVGPRDCWKKYDHNSALTMCLEGTTNRATNGSHGLAHKGTAEVLDDVLGKPDMSYTEAKERISKMLAKPYGCNPDCIKAQLDESYKKMHACGDLKNAQVTPHSGESGGGPKLPDTNTPM
jgi:hypothetical protein